MADKQNLAFWGVALAALFSIPVQAGEWENYLELKEAVVRSKAKRDIPLPSWIDARPYEPRPHSYLETRKPQAPALAPEPEKLAACKGEKCV
jgi:hypothetical protein